MSDGSERARARRLRIVAALLLLPACCIAWELLWAAAGFSTARLLATGASLVLVTILAALLIGPYRWRNYCDLFFLARIARFEGRQPVARRWFCWLAILIAWSSFLVAIQRGAPLQDLQTTDSAAFSREAAEIADKGGPLALVGMLYDGTYDEANQHPLLIGILSTADNDVISHQSVTTGISMAGFILLTLLVIRLAGHQVGAVFAALLGTNATFGHLSLQVTCECLLIPLATVCWWILQRWTQNAHRTNPWRVGLAAGALLGLVQLAKGTGPIFLAGTLAWLLLPGCCLAQAPPGSTDPELEPAGKPRRRYLALALLAAWITIASPLLVRNLRMHGNPLYNVNSHFLFMDEFENPTEVARRTTIHQAASEYFSSHGIGEMVQREATGLAWESFNVARLLGPQPLKESRILPGILLLLLALLGIGLCPGRGYLLLACWLLLLVPLFAWYDPIVRSGERFLAPVIPALLFYAAVAASRLLSPASMVPGSKARHHLLPLACIAWCLIWNGATWIGYGADLLSP